MALPGAAAQSSLVSTIRARMRNALPLIGLALAVIVNAAWIAFWVTSSLGLCRETELASSRFAARRRPIVSAPTHAPNIDPSKKPAANINACTPSRRSIHSERPTFRKPRRLAYVFTFVFSDLAFSYFSVRAAAPASVAGDRRVASVARRAELPIRPRNWDRHGCQQFRCRHTVRIFGRHS